MKTLDQFYKDFASWAHMLSVWIRQRQGSSSKCGLGAGQPGSTPGSSTYVSCLFPRVQDGDNNGNFFTEL